MNCNFIFVYIYKLFIDYHNVSIVSYSNADKTMLFFFFNQKSYAKNFYF